MKRTRKGFTIIELMVVIGILLVLIGLVTLGLSKVGENQKAKNTQQMLEGLLSMHEELNAKTRLRDIQTILVDPDVRIVDASQMDDKPFDNPAIVQTQRMMKKMLSVPTNKSTMQQLPSDRFLWELPAGASAPNLEKDKSNSSKLAVPLPVDAWGNPIIYVPPPDTRPGSIPAWPERYGLHGVYLEQDPSTARPVLNPRQGYPNNNDFIMLATFRPFWLSAGPDGRFGQMNDNPDPKKRTPAGDDNIYSFENNQ